MIIKNKHIPFKGFKAMAIWPFIFARSDQSMHEHDINHERIHHQQQKELFLIGFYLMYFLEYLFYLIFLWDSEKAYFMISFEQEAYNHEHDINYLSKRKRFAQWRN